MFIKIVYEGIEDNSIEPFEATLECRKYALRRNQDRQLVLDADNGEHIYVIDKDCSVYVMSNEGRTIDRIK